MTVQRPTGPHRRLVATESLYKHEAAKCLYRKMSYAISLIFFLSSKIVGLPREPVIDLIRLESVGYQRVPSSMLMGGREMRGGAVSIRCNKQSVGLCGSKSGAEPGGFHPARSCTSRSRRSNSDAI